MCRLDKELHSKGFAKSRTVAAELIAEGKVTVNGRVCSKPSYPVEANDLIEVSGGAAVLKYVSRGGLKLEHSLKVFDIELDELVCLDVGASTGGFTDCMLQNNAKRVYAVDVGTSQLDVSLRENERVVSMEQCDIRNAVLPEKADFIGVDVSFISLKHIIPHLGRFLKNGGKSVMLIKPQFESGKRHKGLISDKKVRDKIADDISLFAEKCGFNVKGLIESPVTGKSGNREFLMYAEAGSHE
ncbi:MAG: TlyA family RNA methyltransferase [Oscillospiraceae bacterium]|nr:TlyA family RNA methyltransferase [Oscillospiraceae bacterium]